MPLLRRLLQQKVYLDLIFLDPPYKDQLAYETVLRFLAEHPILQARCDCGRGAFSTLFLAKA